MKRLASQVLKQLASDYSDEFPTAAVLIEQAFYADDCLTGANTLQEACHIREELSQLLDRPCASGELLDSIPEELRETSALNITSSPGEHGKALGIHWDTDKTVCMLLLQISHQPSQPASEVCLLS